MQDAKLILLDETAVTSSAVSTNPVLDLGAEGDAVKQPCLNIRATQGFEGGTSIEFKLQTSADAAFTSPVTLGVWTAALADLTKVFKVIQRLPYGLKRYLKLTATPTGTFTAGKVKAFITWGPEMPMGGEMIEEDEDESDAS